MPYEMFVSGKQRVLPSTKIGKTSDGKFTVKSGTKAPKEFNTLEDVIGFLNSEFGFINKQKQIIPPDAELRWMEDKQTVLLPKVSAAERSAAKKTAEEKKIEDKRSAEDSKFKQKDYKLQGLTLDQLRFKALGPLLLVNMFSPKFMMIKSILLSLIRCGYALWSRENGNLSPENIPTFNVYGNHSYYFNVSDSQPLNLKKVELDFSGWIHYKMESIYISDQSKSHFYPVHEMENSIENFVLKKVEELMKK